MSDEIESARVPVAWEALEDAFENNSPDVHSYLHLETGEVLRMVDGVADAAMHARVIEDRLYMRIDPVSSREQYRWMERFIGTIEEEELRHKLLAAIDGKGAFRRFKDALIGHPADRERWFTFRSERLRACMEAWLVTHGISPVERPTWSVPSSAPRTSEASGDGAAALEALREKINALEPRDAETALDFVDFLIARAARPGSRG